MSAPDSSDQRHRRGAGARLGIAVLCLLIAVITVVGAVALRSHQRGNADERRAGQAGTESPSPVLERTASSRGSKPAPASNGSDGSTTSPQGTNPTTTTTTATATRPAKPAVTTREGMWWGVDSSGPITPAAIENVRDWYRGATPQFWGRYVSGHYAVSAHELAYARHQGIYVYLLVNDRNCSQCDGGRDVCGRDRTAEQARTDALAALRAAKAVGVPARTVLFKDIEQVSGCHGEPTATYLDTWYRTLRDTDFRTGFYGNAHQQNFDFPRAYCAVVARDPEFRNDVALDMNEDEPQLGAPRGTVGPRNAPRFTPLKPDCAPAEAVQLWQYGESTSRANYTDIDQARPDVKGLLAPDGGVTGG